MAKTDVNGIERYHYKVTVIKRLEANNNGFKTGLNHEQTDCIATNWDTEGLIETQFL